MAAAAGLAALAHNAKPRQAGAMKQAAELAAVMAVLAVLVLVVLYRAVLGGDKPTDTYIGGYDDGEDGTWQHDGEGGEGGE